MKRRAPLIWLLGVFFFSTHAMSEDDWLKKDEFLFCNVAGTDSKMEKLIPITSSWEGDEWLGDGTDSFFINGHFEHIMVAYSIDEKRDLDFELWIHVTTQTMRFTIYDFVGANGNRDRRTVAERIVSKKEFRDLSAITMAIPLNPRASRKLLYNHFLLQCRVGLESERKKNSNSIRP